MKKGPIAVAGCKRCSLRRSITNPVVPQNPLEALLKCLLDPIPAVYDSIDLGWGPRICFVNKLPGDADAAGFRTALGETLMN